MINFKLWLEFNYSVPEDKEQQLFDFYMLSYLTGRDSFDARQQQELEKSGTNIYQLGRAKSPEGSFSREDKIDQDLDHALDVLLPRLKNDLLEAVFFSVSAEFRHAFDINSIENIKNFVNEEEYGYISSYVNTFSLGQTNFSIRRTFKGQNRMYGESYKIVLKTFPNKIEFIRTAKKLFENAKWRDGFGGKPWANICNGYLNLNTAKNKSSMMVWIDHVYSLQHNNDTVLNKIKEYAKDGGYHWIRKALDLKAKIKNPHEIIYKISAGLKKIAIKAIKMKMGVSYDSFAKNNQFADPNKAYEFASQLKDQNKPIPKACVDSIASDGDTALIYAKYILKGPFPEGEATISKDAGVAMNYARNILKGPFPLGEPAISKTSWFALRYAKDILNGRFELGEKAISRSPGDSFMYANNILGDRFELGEKAISKSPNYSLVYARDIIKGRFELGEKAIAESPEDSFTYARDIIKGRFELGEKAIAESDVFSVDYAMSVLRSRFPLGEKAIAKDSRWSYEYASSVLRNRFPLGEDAIAKSPEYSYLYAKYVLKQRFIPGERLIMNSSEKEGYEKLFNINLRGVVN